MYKRVYDEAGGDINAVIEVHQAHFLESGRTRGWFDLPHFDGKTLHASKVPYDEAAYLAATTPEEVRKAFCFCALVREAENPDRPYLLLQGGRMGQAVLRGHHGGGVQAVRDHPLNLEGGSFLRLGLPPGLSCGLLITPM